ncbi:MAG: hypothetical protein ACE5K4_02615 [Candidatus Hydrothermarchaeota archaeon]
MDNESKAAMVYMLFGVLSGILSWALVLGVLFAPVILVLVGRLNEKILKITVEDIGGSKGWFGNCFVPFVLLWLFTWILLFNLF